MSARPGAHPPRAGGPAGGQADTEALDTRLAALHRARPRSRFLRTSVVLLAGLGVYVWFSGEIEVADLFQQRRADNLQRFLAEEALPRPLRKPEEGGSVGAWLGSIWSERGARGVGLTLAISWLAMTLAGAWALLTSPLGARTLMQRDPYLGRAAGIGPSTASGRGWRALATAVRVFAVLLRAIPEYVWAFLLLAIFGPTAWPAVLALAIHNAGILGRLGADTVKNLPPRPAQALRQVGASRSQLAVAYFFPQGLGRFLLFFFYRFETCVREATVLGMLGVVSLGYWIREAMARDRFDEMLVLIGLGALLVLFADAMSWWARGWVRASGLAAGTRPPGPAPRGDGPAGGRPHGDGSAGGGATDEASPSAARRKRADA